MPHATGGFGDDETLLILAAAVLVYIVARSAMDVLSAGRGLTAGRLALAHVMPVAAVAWVSAASGQGDLALATILGSSVAAMALVTGLALTNGPYEETPPSVRAWQFLLPVTLTLLLVGFGARLNMTHAAMLAAFGMLIAGIWREGERTAPETLSATDVETAAPELPRRDALWWFRAVFTILLACVAGWLATRGAIGVAASRRGLSVGVVGVTVISAMLTLPAVGTATLLGRTGRASMAIATQVGTVLFLLSLVLPVAIVLTHVRSAIRWTTDTATSADAIQVGRFVFDRAKAAPLSFPVGLWRIETVLLIALALPLLPVAMGRWKPGKAEGTVLIVGYVLYLALVTAMGDRWH